MTFPPRRICCWFWFLLRFYPFCVKKRALINHNFTIFKHFCYEYGKRVGFFVLPPKAKTKLVQWFIGEANFEETEISSFDSRGIPIQFGSESRTIKHKRNWRSGLKISTNLSKFFLSQKRINHLIAITSNDCGFYFINFLILILIWFIWNLVESTEYKWCIIWCETESV